MTRLLIVGIDGATWTLICPLANAGQMPALAGLMRHGTVGTLQSYPYSASPVVWTSIATGKIPAKHGIRDFYTPQSHLQAKRLWEILARVGWRVGIYQFLCTWPPRKVPGFLIPGWLAKDTTTYPPELSFITAFKAGEQRSSNDPGDYIRFFFRALQNGLSLSTLLQAARFMAWRLTARQRTELDKYRAQILDIALSTDMFLGLLKRMRPDFATIIFYETDAAGHKYWKFKQPELFEGVSAQEARRYGQVLDQVYISTDWALGRILREVTDDCTVLVVSDHGMGPALHPSRRFYRPLLGQLLDAQVLYDKETHSYIGNDFFIRLNDDPVQAQVECDHLVSLIEGLVLADTGAPIFETERVATDFLRVGMALAGPEYVTKQVHLPDGRTVPYTDLVDISETFSGRHEPEGIFVLKGPHVPAGVRLGNVRVVDVVPTMLALMGEPVARDMDGQVIEAAISPHWLQTHPVRWIGSYGGPEGFEENQPEVSPQDLDALVKRLRDLGYIE